LEHFAANEIHRASAQPLVDALFSRYRLAEGIVFLFLAVSLTAKLLLYLYSIVPVGVP
jgi:hypothetical protein